MIIFHTVFLHPLQMPDGSISYALCPPQNQQHQQHQRVLLHQHHLQPIAQQLPTHVLPTHVLPPQVQPIAQQLPTHVLPPQVQPFPHTLQQQQQQLHQQFTNVGQRHQVHLPQPPMPPPQPPMLQMHHSQPLMQAAGASQVLRLDTGAAQALRFGQNAGMMMLNGGSSSGRGDDFAFNSSCPPGALQGQAASNLQPTTCSLQPSLARVDGAINGGLSRGTVHVAPPTPVPSGECAARLSDGNTTKQPLNAAQSAIALNLVSVRGEDTVKPQTPAAPTEVAALSQGENAVVIQGTDPGINVGTAPPSLAAADLPTKTADHPPTQRAAITTGVAAATVADCDAGGVRTNEPRDAPKAPRESHKRSASIQAKLSLREQQVQLERQCQSSMQHLQHLQRLQEQQQQMLGKLIGAKKLRHAPAGGAATGAAAAGSASTTSAFCTAAPTSRMVTSFAGGPLGAPGLTAQAANRPTDSPLISVPVAAAALAASAAANSSSMFRTLQFQGSSTEPQQAQPPIHPTAPASIQLPPRPRVLDLSK